MAKTEHIDVITKEGSKILKKGQILMFDQDGYRNDYKITNIVHGKVFAKKVRTYSPDEVNVTEINSDGTDKKA